MWTSALFKAKTSVFSKFKEYPHGQGGESVVRDFVRRLSWMAPKEKIRDRAIKMCAYSNIAK